MKKDALQPLPVHIFLVGLYPLFFLWSENFDQIPVFALSRAFVFSLIVIVAVFLAGLALFRNLHKAGVFTSIFLLLFYGYGHLFPSLNKTIIFGFMIGRHRYLLAILALILAACAVILLLKKPPVRFTVILNLFSAVLVGMVLFQVITPYVTDPGLVQIELNAVRSPSRSPLAQASPADGRDVYYILLDGYGREDLLAEQGLDNGAFVKELRELGFMVQDCALSNYARTPLSLGSSLNMNYLDALGVQEDPATEHIQYTRLGDMLQHSLARTQFEELGYQFVAFKGVYSWLNIQDADVYVNSDAGTSLFDQQETINFQHLFLHTSALMYLYDLQASSPQLFEKMPTSFQRFIFPDASVFSTREYRQYQANLYALERLGDIVKMPGKQFVYAHLFITHQPYVFNPDGSFRWPPLDDTNAYNDQVRFVNPRIIALLKEILANAAVPPVIVIQGDHSFPLNREDRMKILNAYYLPENGAQKLYPQITPVNTFRLIFDTYFGQDYPLLEDHSYYSDGSLPYQFEEIPITCPAGN